MNTTIHTKEAIALLAFISMVKEAQPNSVLFQEPFYKMALRIGMGDSRTFAKYLHKCMDAGVCFGEEQRFNTTGVRTAYKFISYEKALTLLLGLTSRQLRQMPRHRGKYRFKEYQYKIELDWMGLAIRKQASKISSHFPDKNNMMHEINDLAKLPVPERNTRSNRRRISRLLRRHSAADQRLHESKLAGHTEDVVTGCRHVAKHLGMTPTTGAKRLRKWKADGVMEYENVTSICKVGSRVEAHHLIDALRAKTRGKVIYVYLPRECAILGIYGKRVTGFKSAGYSYGKMKKNELHIKRGEGASRASHMGIIL